MSSLSCPICHKHFTKRYSMKRHYTRIHPKVEVPEYLSPKVKDSMKCAICDSIQHNFNDLECHLLSHNIKLQTEIVHFENKTLFYEWKKRLEDEEKVQYVQNTGRRVSTNNSITTYYVCHRSGSYKPMVSSLERKRQLKIQGSLKINAFCPSRIKATFQPRGNVVVEFCWTHLGHSNDLAHLNPCHDLKLECERKEEKKPLVSSLSTLGSKVIDLKSMLPSENDYRKIKFRHKMSLKLKENSVVKCKDVLEPAWIVRSEDEQQCRVKSLKSVCDCLLFCKYCKVCSHKYTCTCPDASVKGNLCKHMHLLCQINNSDGRTIEHNTSNISLQNEVEPKGSSNHLDSEIDELKSEAMQFDRVVNEFHCEGKLLQNEPNELDFETEEFIINCEEALLKRSTDHLNCTADQLNCTSNQLSSHIEQSNCPTNPIICNTDHLSCSTNQIHCDTDQLNCVTNQIPCDTDQLNCVTNQIPCDTDQLNCVTNQIPCDTDQLNCVTHQIPCNTDQLNCSPDQLITNQLNCSPDQLITNQLNCSPDQLITNQLHCDTSQINCNTDELNCFTSQIPCNTDQLNCATNQLIGNNNHLNFSPTQLNCNPNQINCSPNQLNYDTDHITCSTDQLNCVTNQIPCNTDQLNCVNNQISCNTDSLNCSPDQLITNQLHCDTSQINCNTNQLSTVLNQSDCASIPLDYGGPQLNCTTNQLNYDQNQFNYNTNQLIFEDLNQNNCEIVPDDLSNAKNEIFEEFKNLLESAKSQQDINLLRIGVRGLKTFIETIEITQDQGIQVPKIDQNTEKDDSVIKLIYDKVGNNC